MALSPELFKRLSDLNRRFLRDRIPRADRLEGAAEAEEAAPEGEVGPLLLETVLPGEECRAGEGCFYRIRRPADTFYPQGGAGDDAETLDGPAVMAAYRRLFDGAGCRVLPEDLHETVRPILEVDPGRTTYLDIESCGLAGEPLFLVGLMRYREGGLEVDQFLARHYGEEGPMLAAVGDELTGSQCLVTFNGKSFDWPTIAARRMAWGLFDPPEVPWHVDLLHEARRRWRSEVPNCKLQTLEQLLCGRRRVGDIPGHLIPEAYHEFVRAHQDGNVLRRNRSLRRLQTILHHNALDLVTMAELVVHILSGRA